MTERYDVVGSEIVVQCELGQLQFRLIQFIERASKMDKHQVALMPQQGKQGGLSVGICFHLGQDSGGCLDDRSSCWPKSVGATRHQRIRII